MNHDKKDTIEIFSTCPQYADYGNDYMEQVRKVATWSEQCGCTGILIYTDNRQADPWVVAQVILENTEKLCPLIAIQPVYMHPFTVANKLVTLGKLYNRRIYLNLVAGGFRNDLTAMNDNTPHDKRYGRLVEYTSIIKELTQSGRPVTYNGEFYKVSNLKLTPEPDPELLPGIFLSGSSEAGMEAAKALRATAIQYPLPSNNYVLPLDRSELNFGIRTGIIARIQENEAWVAGNQRFPATREGELAHKLALKTTDSQWYKDLAAVSNTVGDNFSGTSIYGEPAASFWLHPFKSYKTMCPYLVGSYEAVGLELSRYMDLGYSTFILDIPQSLEDMIHTQRAFRLAMRRVAA